MTFLFPFAIFCRLNNPDTFIEVFLETFFPPLSVFSVRIKYRGQPWKKLFRHFKRSASHTFRMKNKFLFALTLVLLSSASNLYAREIDTNTAKLQAMNKLTGKVSVLEAPVNGEVKFGSFSIVVRACKTRPPEETPDNFAFVVLIKVFVYLLF